MKHERRFRDADDFDGYDRGRRKKDKGRRRGKGEGELFAERQSNDDELSFVAVPQKQERQPQQQPGAVQQFRFNEASTIEVKGYKIDLSRVKSVEKQETVHNGRPSHGIEFTFMGKNGYGRTIWYGTNSKQRDEEYEKYITLWRAASASA